MKKMNKSRLATAVAAGALAATAGYAPSASANGAGAADLEGRVQQLESMLQAMQAELNRVKMESQQGAQKAMELEEWAASVKAAPEEKDNMVFFRGGYARNDHNRDGVSIYNDDAPVVGALNGNTGGKGDEDAWYIGAGFDFSVNDNLFGLMDNTEVLAELMFEWKEFSDDTDSNVLARSSVSVSQFTLSAAPKIKFMKGSDFRPWIIPFGLAAHVISPPSEAITVFNPGVMFGGGADYKIWNDIYIGADARYHLTGGDGDGVNTDGFTAGGYIGLGF